MGFVLLQSLLRQVPVRALTFSTQLLHRGQQCPSPHHSPVFLPFPFPLNNVPFSQAVLFKAPTPIPSAYSMAGQAHGPPLLSVWRAVTYQLLICRDWSFLRAVVMTSVRLLGFQ